MAMNDRVEYNIGDITAGQLAPSQSARTNFVAGTSGAGRIQDANWSKDNRIPTGTPAFDGESAGPVEMGRVRVVKLGRNIVCDQTVLAPVVTGTRVETRDEVGVNGTNTTTDTVQPSNIAKQERQTGSDWIKGV